jgi:hypothetical protein
MSNAVAIKGAHRPPVARRSTMETLIVTPDIANQWRIPAFQRPVRVNEKVRMLAKEIANNESIPGVITLGKLEKDPHLYVVDGQHRIESFRESGCQEALADVRIVSFADMADMADAFVDLNTALVKMRPDDILRGLEGSTPVLQQIREGAPFVGYDYIRRGTYSPILSMSMTIRCWHGSAAETPTSSTNSLSTRDALEALDRDSVENLIIFLRTALEAWGKDTQNNRLWSSLNLTMVMWTFRRLVLGYNLSAQVRTERLSIVQFKQCLMALSADSNYLDWLVGRTLSERDRGPCYKRMKDAFVSRLQVEGKPKPRLLSPSWVSS